MPRATGPWFSESLHVNLPAVEGAQARVYSYLCLCLCVSLYLMYLFSEHPHTNLNKVFVDMALPLSFEKVV